MNSIRDKNIPIGKIKSFHITGVDRNNKRFKIETSSFEYACMINLWNGSVWAVLENNKRKRLKRVIN